MKPKILAIDCETSPMLAYTWGAYDQNISPAQVVRFGSVTCFGATWVGTSERLFFSDWQHGHRTMLRELHKLLSSADAVVHYNGDKFDLRKFNGQFLLHRLSPIPPLTSIDCLKTIRKMGFEINKLEAIGPMLELGQKVKHHGFKLWREVMDGDPKAQKTMERYCRQDVRLLIQLYQRLKPYMAQHPHLGDIGRGECGACGGKHLQARGYRRTKAFKIARLQCQTCGSWQDGTKTRTK